MAGGWVAGDSIPNLQWLHCVGWRPEGPSLWVLVPTSIKRAVASDTTPSCSGFLFPISFMFLKGTVPWYFERFWNYEYSVYLEDREGLCRSKEKLDMLRTSTLQLQSKLHVCRKGPMSPMQRDDERLIMSRLQVIIPYFCFPNFP